MITNQIELYSFRMFHKYYYLTWQVLTTQQIQWFKTLIYGNGQWYGADGRGMAAGQIAKIPD